VCMKRTRVKDESSVPASLGNWAYHIQDCIGGSQILTGNVYQAGQYYKLSFQRITDELLPKSDFRTRYCHHVRWKWHGGPFSQVMGDRKADVSWNERHNLVAPPHPYLNALASETWSPSEFWGDMNAFNARAFNAMKPSLEGDVSLTNFLLELKDFKHISRLFSKINDISKRLSEGHLTWAFAIKPLISDLSAIWSNLINYEEKLRDFLERAKLPQKRYYSEDVDLDDVNPSWTDADGYYEYRWRQKGKLTRVATMSYTYELAEIKSEIMRLKALRAMLGLRLTPSVIWNAIPFSFVVDWVVNLGKFLESREDDLLEPDVTISDYSLSCKVVLAGWYDERLPDVCNVQSLITNGSLASFNIKYYRRIRCLPETEGVPLTLSLPSSNQLVLAASLINVAR
jgi:hypothetical protein